MKKIYAFIAIIVAFYICLGLFVMNLISFNLESLQGPSVKNTNISVIGEYLLYEEHWDVGGLTKAINLKTGDTKVVDIGLGYVYNVSIYKDEIYYIESKGFSPGFDFVYKRGAKSLFEKRMTKDKVGDFYIYNDFLYYSKNAYASDRDSNENGNIFRINLSTRKKEKIINCETEEFYVADDKVYYIRSSDESYDKYKKTLGDAIICHSLQNNTEEVIVKDWINDFCIAENNIIYSRYVPDENGNQREGNYELLWLNLSTNETVKICNDVRSFALYNNNICYIDNTSLDVVNIFNCISNDVKSVHAENINYDRDFLLYNNKIYYYDQEDKLCEQLVPNGN